MNLTWKKKKKQKFISDSKLLHTDSELQNKYPTKLFNTWLFLMPSVQEIKL